MRNRMQMIMCTGTVVLGLYLAFVASGDAAAYGWVVAVLGLLGLLASAALAGAARPGRE